VSNYTYDKNGNLLGENATDLSYRKSHWTYSRDVAGNLLKVVNYTSVQGFYVYDGLGRRVETKEGTSATFYGYSGTETLAEETPAGSATDYVKAGGMRIARTGSTVSTYYYQTDAMGSTRLVTDSAGKVVFSDNYQPYGSDNTSKGSETYRFTGKPVSQTTGLYYYGARWYDPTIGRFISQDPLLGHASDPQSMNPYVYVENRPTNDVDPTGQFLVEALFGAGIGAGIGYFGCVWATGGWTSSACGEAALAGGAVGALAGLTYGASLAFAGGTLGLGTATASGGFVFSGASGLAAFTFAG